MADDDPIRIGSPANTGSRETRLSCNAGDPTLRVHAFVARNELAGDGIQGFTNLGSGVFGSGNIGVFGTGSSRGVAGDSPSVVGVSGDSTSGTGVRGNSASGTGVQGNSGPRSTTSSRGVGVFGSGVIDGVRGEGGQAGVHGKASRLTGMGVFAEAEEGTAVHAQSTRGVGLVAIGGTGVNGSSSSGIGVSGVSSTGKGVYGECTNPDLINDKVAGYFQGSLTVVGTKNSKIDHPLEPENRYLLHTCVESSEMKNVYDGVVQLDEDGEASVELPEWFEALNGDFRYQLTAVGGSAPNLHIAEEISENRFRIAGGEGGMKVCWQLTGTRKDPWAAANPFVVEQEKPEEERGRYLEPSLYDAPEEQRVMMIEPIAEAVEEEQRPPEPSGIDFARLEEEHRRQIDELRRLEEEHRREMEELRRRMEEQQEEPPPEST